tara:strand:+ start:165 stop:572 length:408 start_codon:yes stop_codon:yes gene_type:complete
VEEKYKKIIKISVKTYLIGILPSLIIANHIGNHAVSVFLISILAPFTVWSILLFIIGIPYLVKNYEISTYLQYFLMKNILLVSVVCLWVTALFIKVFDIKEEYKNTNQTEETITDKPLENLKDGEFKEENFEPVE